MRIDKLVKTAVGALEDIKARDIVVLNVSKITPLFDRMIIASAESARQTRALSRNVQEEVKKAGGTVHGVEGEGSAEWILVDLGDAVVHIMQPAVREYYDLEQLWGGERPTRAAQRRAASARAR
ncbi:MAG TPA: ribosome silencing factor [Pelomicrobium sp.]|nr:ribosome silencing factor [Pelomicrobium sp.]